MTDPEAEVMYVQRRGDSSPRRERVVDVLGPSIPRVSGDVRTERWDACASCSELDGAVCGVDGSPMPLRTWITDAVCPMGKWVR